MATKENKEMVENIQFKIDYTQFFATKIDVMECKNELLKEVSILRKEISDVRTELKGDIHSLRAELKEDIHSLRTELKEDIYNLDRKIDNMSSKFLWGVLAIIIAPIIVNILSKKFGIF